ncbi:MAG: 50S ribosomal protein L31e [Nitrososphaeria archaeon]
MADESLVTVSFRKVYSLPVYKRSRKAVRRLRREIMRKFKVNEVKISPEVNEALWSRGDKLEIRRISVKVNVDRAASVAVIELPKAEEKTEKEEKEAQQQ